MKLFFKFYFLLILCIIKVQVYANAYTELTPKEQSAAHAIWKLQGKTGASGTGFFIAPDRIVTNFHVIENLLQKDELKNIKLLQENNLELMESDIKMTKIIALSATHDLAILETNKSSNSYLKIRTNPDREIQNLFFLGYPHSRFFKINQIGPLQILHSEMIFFINSSGIEGASGSPVLDAENQVNGIVSAVTGNLMYSIQSDKLNLLMEGNLGFQCKTYTSRTCIEEAINLTLEKAEKGDVHAQYQISAIYFHGIGMEQNIDKAFVWLRKSAELGYPPSQTELGSAYSYGFGVERDLNKAFEWFQKAAELNHVPAQLELGFMYFYGDGVEQDQNKMFEWFQKAAKQGYTPAQLELGFLYSNGEGVEQDLNKAFEWFQKAAELNHAPAQLELGLLYFYGEGVEQDLNKAFEWFQKAAELGYAPAQLELAWMYFNGLGVEQKIDQSIEWLQKAIEQGYTPAYVLLDEIQAF